MEEKKRGRGRPRAYDPDAALDRAAELFWENGYDAGSLEDLSAAMGMGRPSIARAFGDKDALFLKALERYRQTILRRPLEALAETGSPEQSMTNFLRAVVDYSTADPRRLGCLMGSVAAVCPRAEVRRYLRESLDETEAAVAATLEAAVDRDELPADFATHVAARRAVDAMLAVTTRARVGFGREWLRQDVEATARAVLDAGVNAVSAPTAG